MVIFLGDVARRLLVQVYRALDTGFTVVVMVCEVKQRNERQTEQKLSDVKGNGNNCSRDRAIPDDVCRNENGTRTHS